MARAWVLGALSASLLLVGCQAVNTTSGGAVGVERKQYMFSLLSSQQVDQMYAQSYQKTLGEAGGKGVLDKTSANARRVQAIARRLIAQAPTFRPDSAQWQWEVRLITAALVAQYTAARVGWPNSTRTSALRPTWRMRSIRLTASSEWPPSSKKWS